VPPLLCFLSSPLLGPSVWRPVTDALEGSGWQTLIVSAHEPPPTGSGDVLTSFLRQIPGHESVALIPHSNAGLYVAPITESRAVVATVFVDARLPSGESRAALAPAPLLEFLAARADDQGLLPPWTQWWPEDDVASLFPSVDVRAGIEGEQPRVPLAYFRDSVDAPSGWDTIPCAFLAFGATDSEETREAERRGWRVRTLNGGHLHMLVDSAEVAAQIETLLTSMRLHES